MTRKPDYIKKIKELLLPVVQKDGFILCKPNDFIRIQGPFIDSIGFQLSQYVSKQFYVHYYKSLISYPFLKIDTSKANSEMLDVLSELSEPDLEVKSIDELLNLWRNNNIERLKLSKYIVL